MVAIPLSIIFVGVQERIEVDMCECFAYFAVACLCQLCLFMPKTLPLAMKKLSFVWNRQIMIQTSTLVGNHLSYKHIQRGQNSMLPNLWNTK